MIGFRAKIKMIIKVLFMSFVLSFFIILQFYHPFYDSWRNKVDCKLKKGGLVWIDGHDVFECVIKMNDYRKVCSNNDDCEGVCIIDDNWRKWEEFCIEEREGIDVNKFEKKINVEIKGYCSEFNIRHCNEYGYFNVENNIISCTKSEWGIKYTCFGK